MPTENNLGIYSDAIADFRRARLHAKLEQIQARWTGSSAELLEYEHVRKSLRAIGQISRGVQDIPIKSIVGSVGRYTDFTRMFLPRQDSDASRWARVKIAMSDLVGLPPIDVYQIDQVYFVLDGNHRISVARQLGAQYIQAYVTEVLTDVPLSPDVQPDDLILKAEYAEFLSHTQIRQLRPQADLSVRIPGQYQKLEEHISVHRYYMGLEQKREIHSEEAVTHWYDAVYMPVTLINREQGVLSGFPDRTEADLYLWLMEYRAGLAENIGIEVPLAPLAAELVNRYSPAPQRRLERVGKRLLDAVTPKGLAGGPPPGLWQQRTKLRLQETIFADILLAVDGSGTGWRALSWVLAMAQLERLAVHGVHVSAQKTSAQKQRAQTVQAEFDRRIKQAGVKGGLATIEGKVAAVVCERARWMDLVAVSLSHPYDPDPRSRLESGLHAIIRRCPTPVLAIPESNFRLERLLLAYDDSPKAREALFVATYLAGKCQTCLDVVAVAPSLHLADDALIYAKSYLDNHDVKATFVRESGSVTAAILQVAADRTADMIIMGGYGFAPFAELALGSTVEGVLRSSVVPVLVCQ